MRELVNGTRSFVRLDAGMSCDPADVKPELACPLAGGLHAPSRQGRLEDKHGVTAAGLGFHQRSRGDASSLFVGSEQEDDAARGQSILSGQSSDREHTDADARLHVKNTGTVELSVGILHDRHAFQLTDRPHGVEVTQQEHLGRPRAQGGFDMVASGFLRQDIDVRAQRSKATDQLRATSIDRRFVRSRRLQPDQFRGRFHQPVAFGLTELQRSRQVEHRLSLLLAQSATRSTCGAHAVSS